MQNNIFILYNNDLSGLAKKTFTEAGNNIISLVTKLEVLQQQQQQGLFEL